MTVRHSDQRNASRSCAGVAGVISVGELPTVERGLPGLGVHPAVVDGLCPGGEQGVELDQVVEFAAGADLDQELLAHGAEESLDLASSGRLAWPGVHQPDAETGAGAQQLFVHECRAVVDVDAGRDAAGGDAGAQRGFQPHGVFSPRPPVPGQQPGVVIEEGEQDGLAAAHRRPVQRIPGPAHVGCLGLEPAESSRR